MMVLFVAVEVGVGPVLARLLIVELGVFGVFQLGTGFLAGYDLFDVDLIGYPYRVLKFGGLLGHSLPLVEPIFFQDRPRGLKNPKLIQKILEFF
jgi:hypothetical protein